MTDKHGHIKRKLEEENSVKEGDGVDDSHNNVSNMQEEEEEEEGYSSDDYIMTFAGGRKMSRELRKEYLRKDKRERFVPLRSDYYKPICIKLSHMAIDKFNNENVIRNLLILMLVRSELAIS